MELILVVYLEMSDFNKDCLNAPSIRLVLREVWFEGIVPSGQSPKGHILALKFRHTVQPVKPSARLINTLIFRSFINAGVTLLSSATKNLLDLS